MIKLKLSELHQLVYTIIIGIMLMTVTFTVIMAGLLFMWYRQRVLDKEMIMILTLLIMFIAFLVSKIGIYIVLLYRVQLIASHTSKIQTLDELEQLQKLIALPESSLVDNIIMGVQKLVSQWIDAK